MSNAVIGVRALHAINQSWSFAFNTTVVWLFLRFQRCMGTLYFYKMKWTCKSWKTASSLSVLDIYREVDINGY
jgi:hypothetical protein